MSAKDETQQKSQGRSALGSAATLMVFATLASSITGVVRTMVYAHAFGDSDAFEAFTQAFRIPDLFYFLIAGGALRTGFIPVFTEYLVAGETAKAWRTFRVTLLVLLVLGAGVVALGMWQAPLLARHAVGSGLKPEYQDLCAKLMRAMLPAQFFFIIGGLFMGTLNALKHFKTPAAGPIVYNLVIIGGALASLPIARHAGLYEPGPDQLGYRLWCLSMFVVLGAAVGSVFIQIPPLMKLGAKLTPAYDLGDEGLKKLALLAAPVVAGLAVSEINFVIVSNFATTAEGAQYLEYPNRILKLPPRMFGAAIAIALFPTLATHFANGNMAAYCKDLARTMRAVLLLSIPSAVACACLAVPIMRLLFERGAFGPQATTLTAAWVFWGSFGIAPLSLQYVVARGFYALHETKVPLWVGIAAALLNVSLAAIVVDHYGNAGLSAVYSFSTLFTAVMLTWLLRTRVGPLEGRRMVVMLGKVAVACVAMGAACWYGAAWLESLVGTDTLWDNALVCLVPLAAGVATFLALCVILKVEDLQTAINLVASRFRRRSAGPNSKT